MLCYLFMITVTSQIVYLDYNSFYFVFQEEEEEIKLEINVLKKVNNLTDFSLSQILTLYFQ